VTGTGAEASVLIQAKGEYDGTLGDINAIYAGTIRGGTASGNDALSHVNILAAHDIKTIDADTISGGRSSNGAEAFVDILAENDILSLTAGTIMGSENSGSNHCDPFVQIQAYNNIQSIVVDQILAGQNGTVNILAGINASGVSTGGSIGSLIAGLISGDGGIINIAAGGDIGLLRACRIISGDGDVNIVAGGDMTLDVRQVRSWSTQTDTGVSFSAAGEVDVIRNSISSRYITEGEAVELPTPEEAPLPV
jgi:hypothetical protein